MRLISKDEIRALIDIKPDLCVSLYMPTHRTGAEVRQNAIRFKDLLRRAETGAAERGIRRNELEKMFEPARTLLEDDLFWSHQQDGLVVFLCRDSFRHYRLPLRFEESVEVGAGWHLKPLLPLLSDNVDYYLLALDQKQVRLFRCNRFHIAEIELSGFPTGVEDAVKHDDPERQANLQFRSNRAGRERQTQFHGHGVGPDAQGKNDILRFFQQVDRGVQRFLNGANTPMVLFGTGFLLPIYQRVNTYRQLLENGVDKDPQWMSPEELHKLSLEEVEELFGRERQSASEKFHRHLGTGLASDEVEKVVPAAFQGRVEYLFVDTARQERGSFDPETQQVSRGVADGPSAPDLLDFAAVHTVLQEGKVFGFEAVGLSPDKTIAAVFRY